MTARSRRQATSTPGWFNAWNDLSTPIRHGICLVVLGIIAVAFMAPDLFSNRELVGGDIVQWKAMAQSLFEWEAATGTRPLWATGPFMGMPAVEISYALSVPQVDDLARLLRTLFWPTSHLLILFAGAYGLVHYLTRDHWAGVVAAVAFGLTTYLPILLIAGHHSKYVALALVPWLLWAFVYARRSPSLTSALVFAVATAASLRAGHVQITYYAAFLIGVWWLVDAIRSWRGGTLSDFAKSTGWLLAGGVLGILMVADPYLAKAEYKAFTIRGASEGAVAGGMSWDYAMGWSHGWAEMLTLLVANAFGGGGGTYWGAKIFTAGPHYLGGVVLLLAVYAVFVSRRKGVLGVVVATVLMLGFALGENLTVLNRPMFDYFPLFDAFRVPETWLAMVAMALAVLAGIGLRDIVRRAPDSAEDQVASKRVQNVVIGAVALTAVLMLFGGSLLSFQKPGELDQLVRQVAASQPDVSLDDPQTMELLRQAIVRAEDERRDLFAADARRTFLFVLLAGGFLVLARRRKIPGWVAQAALVILVAVDLGGVGRRYFNSDALVQGRRVDAVVPEYGFDAFLKERQEALGGPGHFRVLSLEGDPVVTARPAFHHESLGGYHGAKLRRYQDFLDNVLFDRSTRMPSRTALAISNTRYLVAPGTLPGYQPVFSDQATGYMVFEVPFALDRGFFVDSLIVAPEAPAQWAALQSPFFDPARMAVVGQALDVAPVADSVQSSVRLEQYTPEEIIWQVQTDAPRLFVASEVYYPAGWEAEIDGEAVAIHPADYLLRGVVVPAGEHTVTMRFRPPARRLGVMVSWGATILVYGLFLAQLGIAWRRRT